MKKEDSEKILEKINSLISIPECKDSDYKRKPVDKLLREKIYDEQEGKCFLCLTKTSVPLTHHIIPDGLSERENLVMLCSTCHCFIHGIIHRFLGWRNARKGGFY